MGLGELTLLVGVIAIPVEIIFAIFLAALFDFSRLKNATSIRHKQTRK